MPQAVQAVEPARAAYDGGQFTQTAALVAAVTVLAVPAGHGVQLAAPPVE
jgi:hypothetical protein